MPATKVPALIRSRDVAGRVVHRWVAPGPLVCNRLLVNKTTALLSFVLASACGTVAAVDGGAADAAAVDAMGDASLASDAGPAPKVDCTDAGHYVQVVGDAGDFTFSDGCGDAGAPRAFIGGCSNKVLCLDVVACGSGSIELSSIDGWLPGSHVVVASLGLPDAAASSFSGTMSVSDWPDAGGVVAGEYTASSQTAGTIAGTFCVVRTDR